MHHEGSVHRERGAVLAQCPAIPARSGDPPCAVVRHAERMSVRPDRSLGRTRGLPGGNPGKDPGDAADLPSIRIDAGNEAPWCGERRLDLTPRVFAVLRHLVEHPNRLITRDDLLAKVWRDTIVSDAAPATCIRDLRRGPGGFFGYSALPRDGASAGIPVHRTDRGAGGSLAHTSGPSGSATAVGARIWRRPWWDGGPS